MSIRVEDRGTRRRPVIKDRLGYGALLISIAAICLVCQQDQTPELVIMLRSGPGLVALCLLGVWWSRARATNDLNVIAEVWSRFPRLAPWILTAGLAGLLLAIGGGVLDGFPNSGDEYAYILQAETYAQGRLWVKEPVLPEVFRASRFFAKDGHWISPYEPGWALVMAPLAALRAPLWLADAALGVLSTVVFYRLARRYISRAAAFLAVLSLTTSAFFLFNFGSYYSHGLAAFCGLSFALFATRYLATSRWSDALTAGLFVGMLGFVRAFNAAIFAAPFLATLAFTPNRRVGSVWFGLGGAPFLLALLAYYRLVTGDALLPVQEWYQRGAEPLGAPTGLSLLETGRRLFRLWFWTSPISGVGWALAAGFLARTRTLRFVDLIFPATVLAFAFYGGGAGNQYGPRYYFEAWPFAVLSGFRVVDWVVFSPTDRRRQDWVAAAALINLFFQIAYLGPRMLREHAVVLEREALFRQVERARISGIVLIASDVSQTRPMVPEDLTRNGLVVGRTRTIYGIDPGPQRRQTVATAYPGRHVYLFKDGMISALALGRTGR